ncbi:helix-turn-helix transcriptional regulator [Paraclostridium dentum]|uniref:helix-turn-helix transcriptional regulator n=1 Tax=Paraclostridium dentum TaxID=2662455 RepID=UPI0014759E45
MNIKLKRIEKGIKQKDMAEMLEITPQYLRKIEKGDIDVRRSFMMKVSEILDTSIQELFFSEGE